MRLTYPIICSSSASFARTLPFPTFTLLPSGRDYFCKYFLTLNNTFSNDSAITLVIIFPYKIGSNYQVFKMLYSSFSTPFATLVKYLSKILAFVVFNVSFLEGGGGISVAFILIIYMLILQ